MSVAARCRWIPKAGRSKADSVPLARLTLTDFRSYAAAEIAPDPGFIILTGDNGAGKTNVLEAISLLVPGRGLRGAALTDIARRDGPGGFSVNALLELETRLGVGALPSAPERRIVRINGVAAPSAALGEWLSLVWLSPAQDRLFVDPPGERRRFLDRLAFALEPSHAHHAARYEAAMRQRNRLLAESAPDTLWLDSLEMAMVEHGAALDAARQRLIDDLNAILRQQDDNAFPRAGLALAGWNGTFAYDRERVRDAAAGRTLSGPHRQDLVVYHIDKGLAAHGSTGEQKALLLSIVLAHCELIRLRRSAPPVLLLDEVAAHLDPRRRTALFRRLEGRGQVWMTGTERASFEDARDAGHFHVSAGAIRPI